MTSKSKVYFFFDNVSVNLKDRTKIKRAIELIFKKERKKLDCLRYIFCNDSTLLSINKQYLRHNYYTDIITFDLSKTKGRIEGEIYISVDRLKENAGIFKTSFLNELLRVVFHGALHLCGYNDKTVIDKKKMKGKEEFYLGRFK